MPRARKTDAPKRPTWSGIKANLALMDRSGLVALIRDLYDLDALNRRALQARSHRTVRRSISIVVWSEQRSFLIRSVNARFDCATPRQQSDSTRGPPGMWQARST